MSFLKVNMAIWKIINLICIVVSGIFVLIWFLSVLPLDTNSFALESGARTKIAALAAAFYFAHKFAKYQIRLRASYQLYNEILSSTYIRSPEELASAANQPVEEVLKNIKALKTQRFLLNLNFNPEDYMRDDVEEEKDATPQDSRVIACPNCGARNTIEARNGNLCDYCGSHLK